MGAQDDERVTPVVAEDGNARQRFTGPEESENRHEGQEIELPVSREHLEIQVDKVTQQINGYRDRQQSDNAILIPTRRCQCAQTLHAPAQHEVRQGHQ